MSTVGLCVVLTKGNTYQFATQGEVNYDHRIANSGRDGGKEVRRDWQQQIDVLSANPRERMRAISKAMSKELRHGEQPDRQYDGFMPLESLLGTPSSKELFATQTRYDKWYVDLVGITNCALKCAA